MKLHDCDLRIELRELLEPVARPLGPGRERRADLCLERVVLGEQRRRCRHVAPVVGRRAAREVARLSVGPEAERERERRPALPKLGLGRGGRSGVPVRGQHGDADDRDCRDRDGNDQQRNSTAGGHRTTIATAPTL